MKKSNNSNIEDDQSFIAHLEALRHTLLNSIFAVVLLSPLGFYFAPKFIDWLIAVSLPDNMPKLHYFSPMEVFIIQLKAGLVLAFIFASPFVAYQVRKFVLPALYENERKFLGWFMALFVILFVSGCAFCIFLILPLVMNFSVGFMSEKLEPTIGLANFVNLASGLILAFGIMFQFPLAVLAGVKFGLVSVETLKNLRPYIIVGILILAAIFTPPDVVSQLLLGVPTWLLFEAGLFAASLIEKKNEEEG